MSIQSVKVAISLPKEIMAEVEDFRHRLGLGRSQAILQAVSLWLKKAQEDAMDKKYISGYKKNPENPKEISPLFFVGLDGFSKEKW